MKSSIARTSSPPSRSAAAVPPVETQLDAELGQPARELHDARLVRHREQRALHADLTRLHHRLHRVAEDTWSRHQRILHEDAPRVGWVRADGPAGDQRDRSGQQIVLDRPQRLAHLVRVGDVRQLDARAAG